MIIAAAGHGVRMGSDVPKQYLKIAGKPVLRHTIERFLSHPGLKSLRVIIDPEHAQWYHDAVKGLDLPAPAAGGNKRNISINNALSKFTNVLDDDIVLIHDAVRPLLRMSDISLLLDAMNDNQAATLGHPVTDTMRKNSGEIAHEIIERDQVWAIQTPQAFHFSVLKEAHKNAPKGQYTDDTSLVSALGTPVKLVEGSRQNIKITTKDDLEMAEKLVFAATEIRTGTGFDVHAFEDGRKLILCGVEIDHPRGLKGHSDADVGLHAVTDALLGAIAEGDIGHHFPPSDPAFKDMSSDIFLKKAHELVQEKGGSIQNIDLTLICEAPKIGPYRDSMQTRVAEILEIDPGRISIKATTTEGLGFTGRGEGIAAQAIASVKLPGL